MKKNKKLNNNEIESSNYSDKSSYLWAFFLIFIGIVFLLNTLGIVEMNIWGFLLQFWPLILVLIGLNIILSRYKLGSIFVGILGIIIMLILLFIGIFVKEPMNINNKGEILRNEIFISNQDYSEVNTRELDITVGMAEFTLQDMDIEDDNSNDHLKIQSKYFENFGKPELKETLEGKKLILDFDMEKSQIFFGDWNKKNVKYDFYLGRDALETDINVNLGASKGTIDLKRQLIGKLNAEVGAGDLVIDLDGNALLVKEVNINVGAGKVEMDLDKSAAYTLNYSVGMGSIKASGKEYSGLAKESTIKSENYDQAEIYLLINAQVGLGEFVINQ